jgi:3-phenylpropionate/cinnamic acid dioxygenase small subunit
VTSGTTGIGNSGDKHPDSATKQEVAALFDLYVTYLDENRFEEWLELFTDDCYYSMILRRDHVKGTNLVAIGEDKRSLRGRIEVGQTVERDFRTHLLTGTRLDEMGANIVASANFAVVRKGAISCSGRYKMALVRESGTLKITQCTAVLNNEVIEGTIYLPV